MNFQLGFHPFHIVSPSPWPIVGSISVLSVTVNFILFLSSASSLFVLFMSILSLILVSIQWWRDVIRESTFQGFHTLSVCEGLNLGMIMFIISEVMFFFSFFFGFFFSSLNPDPSIGGEWPPMGIQPLSLLEIPLLNTLLLLSSGVSITWCHHSILSSWKIQSTLSGVMTIFLGIVFILFQGWEYNESSFTMSDSVYGSFFFLMTGFHGIHVMVGVLFITVMISRIKTNHFSLSHHLGFEFSAWYWHFVDVVWLLLFVSVYWWGS